MKVYLLGNKKDPDRLGRIESDLIERGYVVVNPQKISASLPREITNAELATILFEVIDVCDAVYIDAGWEKDFVSRIEKRRAEYLHKEFISE